MDASGRVNPRRIRDTREKEVLRRAMCVERVRLSAIMRSLHVVSARR